MFGFGKPLNKGRRWNEATASVGNWVYVFIRDKLKLLINQKKSGVRRPLYECLNLKLFYESLLKVLF